MQLQGYRRDLPYSYSVGYFATLELLRHRPERARRVLVHGRLAAGRRAELERACDAAGLPLEEDDALVERLRRKGDVRALGVFDKYEEALEPARDHLVLVRPSQVGNVGTVVRTMLAFGLRDLALIAPQVDPWSPHVVRASIGARFGVACETLADFAAYRARYPHHPYPFASTGARPLEEVDFRSPWALVFGPEWPGLEPAVARQGTPVRIPQGDEVESLNLAVAAGIALYRATRPG